MTQSVVVGTRSGPTVPGVESIAYAVRAHVDLDELQRLFEEAWGSPKPGYEQVLERSFTWVTAVAGKQLVGFVNVAWDGGVHHFLLDTTVHPATQRAGVGSRLVQEARRACEGTAEWLHVDAAESLMASLYEPCGFDRTQAGLIRLGPPGI